MECHRFTWISMGAHGISMKFHGVPRNPIVFHIISMKPHRNAWRAMGSHIFHGIAWNSREFIKFHEIPCNAIESPQNPLRLPWNTWNFHESPWNPGGSMKIPWGFVDYPWSSMECHSIQ
jgi:hypothetical protein